MPFGIAIVGLDHWYTGFAALDILSASSETPLIGVYDGDPARQTAIRARNPGANIVDSVDQLLSDDDVKLVALCCSTDQAPALAMRAIAAGKHVISVKPAARTRAELEAVVPAADTAGTFFGSFEGMQRLHPRALLLQELVASGVIGTPLSYQQRGHGGLPSPWPGQSGDPAAGGDSWWLHPECAPGGAWIDHAIYAIDLARFVFGATGLQVVGSVIERRVHVGLPLEDYGAALLRLQPSQELSRSPITLIIEDTWAAQAGAGAGRQEILGTSGVIRMDRNAWVVASKGEEVRHPIPESPFFPFDKLAAILSAGEIPPFGPSDALANLTACLDVYSAATPV